MLNDCLKKINFILKERRWEERNECVDVVVDVFIGQNQNQKNVWKSVMQKCEEFNTDQKWNSSQGKNKNETTITLTLLHCLWLTAALLHHSPFAIYLFMCFY